MKGNVKGCILALLNVLIHETDEGKMLTTPELIQRIETMGYSADRRTVHIYGFGVSESMVSEITDKILPEIDMWQKRPLSAVYPIVYVDGIVFNVRENTWRTRT